MGISREEIVLNQIKGTLKTLSNEVFMYFLVIMLISFINISINDNKINKMADEIVSLKGSLNSIQMMTGAIYMETVKHPNLEILESIRKELLIKDKKETK